MKLAGIFCALVLLAPPALSQTGASPAKSVTVPITLDHDRVVVDVYLPLPDGSTKRVRAWVDNGDPDLTLSRNVATLLGLKVTCDEKECSAPPPSSMTIAGMKLSLSGITLAKIPLKAPSVASVMAPGMSAEINLPSTVLRNYDVLVDFPDREFTIAEPGSLKFKGVSTKAAVNASNGLVQIPSRIADKKYNLALDVGSSISFLNDELFDQLAAAHSDWPHMAGAVGPANMWGLPDEPDWKLMRIDRLQYGPLFLTNLAMVEFPKDREEWFEKRAGMPTAGLLGSEALMNYRVGIDYRHAIVYFDLGRTFEFPDFDVVGLVLRPEDDTRFTIVGVANFDGKPSVPDVQAGDHLVAVDGIPVPDSTMGQVWSLLEGSPGQERKLTVERNGKQFNVTAQVQHFLAETEEENSKEKSVKKKSR
ncbi:MAG TPA: PDZ domain-containing protein [Candidatus Sulfotelmatobacter sp.]